MSKNQPERAYLDLLSRQYPTEEAVCSEIIQLGAVLSLPKGTEHFMSDLQGEDEAFRHMLNNCSGAVSYTHRRLRHPDDARTRTGLRARRGLRLRRFPSSGGIKPRKIPIFVPQGRMSALSG